MSDERLQPYPISVVAFDFTFLAHRVDIYVIASPEHFGVLVPLATLPAPKRKMNEDTKIDRVVRAVVNSFDELADDYVAGLDGTFPLPLPDPELLGDDFRYVTIELSGKIGALAGDPPMKDDLVLSGEYVLVCEAHAEVSDFITAPDTPAPATSTLH